MSKETLLEVRHLKKYFSTPAGQLHAVDDVNFDIAKGETLGVVGESGCGKSTLGRAVLRLHEPTSGEVLFRGENILQYNKNQMKDLKKDMQLIFQDPFSSLNPRMTVSQAIALPLIIQGVIRKKDKAALAKRVRELWIWMAWPQRFVNSYPHELDGGRRQRIGHRQSSVAASAVYRLRRAGIGTGRFHSGADIEPDAGPAERYGTDLYVHHPRPVCSKASGG